MRDDPIKTTPVSNCMVIARDAYMSLDHRITTHNNNLAVMGASEEQFRALIKANLAQGSCNYVVLTTSEAAYDDVSAVLIHQGYSVYTYDPSEREQSRATAANLLSQSLATAVFFLFNPENDLSCVHAAASLSQTLSDLLFLREQNSGTGSPPHIQFFLESFDALPIILGFSSALVRARSHGLGIAFSGSGIDRLRELYSIAAKDILRCCDLQLLFGQPRPKPRLFSADYFRNLLFGDVGPDLCCELHVTGLPPRCVIPMERSDTA